MADVAPVPAGPALEAAQLLGPTEVRGLAARLGIQPSKRLGQNFVVDAGTVTKIAAMARIRADDVVLEVGPGFGSLTMPLLAAARRRASKALRFVGRLELPAQPLFPASV